MNLPHNTLLQGGKYRIVRFIDSGGFGCTYEALHVYMNSKVAIKEFFVKDFCNRDEQTNQISVATQSKVELVGKLKKKFVGEAQAIFQMNHPNVVRVMDIFEENGTAYYVMEYIDGESLKSRVKRCGKLSEAETLGYIRQVADALAYVHGLNRLHLDIKPANIMLDRNGHAKLIDFGASKHYDDETGENTSTLMGVNTKGYAPVEQVNASFTHFSPATDIYALGATCYKLLTGITPPSSVGLMIEVEELGPLPGEISQSTRSAIEKAMQLSCRNRYQTIAEFIAALNSVSVLSVDEDLTEVVVDNKREAVSVPHTINGHEYVDLGLSVKWATCNVGASRPEDYGDYFAWGEVKPKQNYTVANSVTYEKYIGNIANNPQYDAAHVNWGGSWRLPTKSEIEELVSNCTTKWTTQKGVKGRLITSKKNGNSIFLPAAGYRSGSLCCHTDEDGYYWSDTFYVRYAGYAFDLYFSSDSFCCNWHSRYRGRTVRPVSE